MGVEKKVKKENEMEWANGCGCGCGGCVRVCVFEGLLNKPFPAFIAKPTNQPTNSGGLFCQILFHSLNFFPVFPNPKHSLLFKYFITLISNPPLLFLNIQSHHIYSSCLTLNPLSPILAVFLLAFIATVFAALFAIIAFRPSSSDSPSWNWTVLLLVTIPSFFFFFYSFPLRTSIWLQIRMFRFRCICLIDRGASWKDGDGGRG